MTVLISFIGIATLEGIFEIFQKFNTCYFVGT